MSATAVDPTNSARPIAVHSTRVFKRLWPVLRVYRRQFLVGIILILSTTLIEILSPIVIGRTVDVAMAGKDVSALYRLCAIYGFLLAMRTILQFCQALVIQRTGQGVTHDLRCLLLSHIQRLEVAYFDKNPSGRLLTRVTNDIKALSELFTASISVLALDVMVILGTVVAMFWIEWRLAAVVLVTFPAVFFIVRIFGNRLAVSYREVRRYLSEINAFLGENIGAIATIQRLSAEKERGERFQSKVDHHFQAQMGSLKLYAMIQPYANFFNGVAMASLIGVGGYWVLQGEITLGIMVAYFGYLRNLFQPIRDLVEKYNTFLSAMVAAERVMDILDEEPESLGGPVGTNGNGTPLKTQRPEISFDGVTFTYPNRDVPAIEEVSFRLRAGESLAVVGRTGSGKSTLIRLLLKFYAPDSGTIRIGSDSLDSWNTMAARSLFGVVHQEMYFFGGTIRENLSLGREGLGDEFLRRQCERAELWRIIEPRGGLDMKIDEGGSNLSVGERQLLAFARVLALDPPVLILDEATSSIDTILEKKLIHAMQEIMAGRTSIVIAHRLSTIQHCNHVLELADGRVVSK